MLEKNFRFEPELSIFARYFIFHFRDGAMNILNFLNKLLIFLMLYCSIITYYYYYSETNALCTIPTFSRSQGWLGSSGC